jgi:hypothetical protein
MVIFMSTSNATNPADRSRSTLAVPTQLSLLALSSLPTALPMVLPDRLPPKLRVSARNRQVGRAGIAEARAILADQASRRAARSGRVAA